MEQLQKNKEKETMEQLLQENLRLEEELAQAQWEKALVEKKIENPEEFQKIMVDQEELLLTINKQKELIDNYEKLIVQYQEDQQKQDIQQEEQKNSEIDNLKKLQEQEYQSSISVEKVVQYYEEKINKIQSITTKQIQCQKELYDKQLEEITESFKQSTLKECQDQNFYLQKQINLLEKINRENEVQLIVKEQEYKNIIMENEEIKERYFSEEEYSKEQKIMDLKENSTQQQQLIEVLHKQVSHWSQLYEQADNELIKITTLYENDRQNLQQKNSIQELEDRLQDCQLKFEKSQQEYKLDLQQKDQIMITMQQKVKNKNENLQSIKLEKAKIEEKYLDKQDENRKLNEILLDKIKIINAIQEELKQHQDNSQQQQQIIKQINIQINDLQLLNQKYKLKEEELLNDRERLANQVQNLTNSLQSKIKIIEQIKLFDVSPKIQEKQFLSNDFFNGDIEEKQFNEKLLNIRKEREKHLGMKNLDQQIEEWNKKYGDLKESNNINELETLTAIKNQLSS